MIYLLILALILFCVWRYDLLEETERKEVFYWGICVIFILLAGLRYEIGIDTRMYMKSWEFYPDFWNMHWFEDISRFQEKASGLNRFQPGWVLYCMIIRSISEDFTLLQIVTALLFNIAIFRTIKKYSRYPFLTILIFYINFKFLEFEFEIMRETVAVSVFLLLAFDNYIKRRWAAYYVGTAFAFFMHTPAILMFMLPLVRNIDWSLKKYTIIMVMPSFLLAVAGRAILGNLINIFLGGSGFIAQYAAGAVENETNLNYLLMYGLQPVLLYLLSAFGFKYIESKEARTIVFFSIIFMNFNMVYFTAGRLVNYLVIQVFIAITPIFYLLIKKCRTELIAVVLCLIYSAPTIYSFKKPENVARYYPYQSVIYHNQTRYQKSIEPFQD